MKITRKPQLKTSLGGMLYPEPSPLRNVPRMHPTILTDENDVNALKLVEFMQEKDSDGFWKVKRPSGDNKPFFVTGCKHTKEHPRGFSFFTGLVLIKMEDSSGFSVGDSIATQSGSFEPKKSSGENSAKIVAKDGNSIWIANGVGGEGFGTPVKVISGSNNEWDVKLCEWNGSGGIDVFGDLIEDVPCWPSTKWPIVGDLALMIKRTDGSDVIIPAFGAALFG